MNVSLSKDQEEWLAASVAQGIFPSPEAAIQQLIEERRIFEAIGDDDLAWAKPLVDEAIASVERGEFLTLEEHLAHMDEHMRALEAKFPPDG